MRLVSEPDYANIHSILDEVAEKFADYNSASVMA